MSTKRQAKKLDKDAAKKVKEDATASLPDSLPALSKKSSSVKKGGAGAAEE
jgi:hypothetical protein